MEVLGKSAFVLFFVAAVEVALGSAMPTQRQIEWADCEIGVIIHQDVQVYVPSYEDHADTNVPPASVFNPSALDTDQWIETAKAAGAKYAVLVAKHCSGFSLWPTKAHGYSVASSPWKDGKGDVVADFIASCRKYGIKPGLYASTGRNNWFGVSDLKAGYKTIPDEKWNRYRDLVRTQLTELWSNYGELFEIWFDGGNLPANRGGKEIEDLIVKLQPNAIVFGGDPGRFACCRWVGNENATSPYDCWGRWTPPEKEGYPEYLKMAAGAPDGKFWCPAESDIPNRNKSKCFQGGWFWRKGEESWLYSPNDLLDRYLKSVGRNSNLLIGMVIDNRGRVPDADVAQFRTFGKLVRSLYRNRLASVSGAGLKFDIDLAADSGASLCSIREDITNGENVRRFRLSGFADGNWKEIASGGTIGHRRLITFAPGAYTRFQLELESIEPGTTPVLRDFELYSLAKRSDTSARFVK
jgi:alpha-L-fucosidase